MAHRKYSDLQLACAVAESKNMREVCTKLGLTACGANYESVRRQIARLGLDGALLRRRRHLSSATRLF